MKKTILENIFTPMTRLEFLGNLLTNKPVVVHQKEKAIDELLNVPLLKSIDDLFQLWNSKVNVYLPGVADEDNSSQFSSHKAKEYFQEGYGVFFDDINHASPILENWLQKIRGELGLSQMTFSRNLAYVIPKGHGTSPHFDQNINIVIQVEGSKKWWVAENNCVDNPLSRFTIGLDIDPELESYSKQNMPSEFPENSQEFTLSPGSILFLPRGVWHKTRALEDSLSLNFTYSAPSWLEYLLAAMRSRIVQSKNWRETALFFTDSELQSHSGEVFSHLISEFAQDVQSWKAEDIIQAIEGPNIE